MLHGLQTACSLTPTHQAPRRGISKAASRRPKGLDLRRWHSEGNGGLHVRGGRVEVTLFGGGVRGDSGMEARARDGCYAPAEEQEVQAWEERRLALGQRRASMFMGQGLIEMGLRAYVGYIITL